MITYRLVRAEPIGPRPLRLTFDNGFAGDYDLSQFCQLPAGARLRDPDFFQKVAVSCDGASLGWCLDAIGEEIDFGAEAARIDLERLEVERLAARYAARLRAAE